MDTTSSSKSGTLLFSFAEAKTFLFLGTPILIAQIASVTMSFRETVMLGAYSTDAVAAVGVAASIFTSILTLGVGSMQAISPLNSQAVGAKRYREASHIFRQSLILSTGLSIAILACLTVLSWNLELFGLTPKMAKMSGDYLRVIMWGEPPFLFYYCIRSLFEGFSKTKPAMVICFIGLVVNIPLAYVLIHGRYGFPQMGIIGSALASAVTSCVMCFSMLCFLLRNPDLQKLRPFFIPLIASKGRARFDRPLLTRMLRIGLPGALARTFEIMLFTLGPLLVAPWGNVETASTHLTLNYLNMVYMVARSLNITTTIRVGQTLGAGNISQARIIARTSLLVGLILGFVASVSTIAFRGYIPGIYTQDPAVLALSTDLLLLAAACQVFDFYQTSCLAVLRGYNDSNGILGASFVSFLGIGLLLSYILVRTDLLHPAMGAAGFMTALFVSLPTIGLITTLRIMYFHRLSAEKVMAQIKK